MHYLIAAVILVVLVTVLLKHIYFVNKNFALVVDRHGEKIVWDHGLHVKLPLTDRVIGKVKLKPQMENINGGLYLTKENLPVQMDFTVSFQVVSPEQYVVHHSESGRILKKEAKRVMYGIIHQISATDLEISRKAASQDATAQLNSVLYYMGIKIQQIELKSTFPFSDKTRTTMGEDSAIALDKRNQALRKERENLNTVKSIVNTTEGGNK